MQIQPIANINQQPTMKAGLHFIKKPAVYCNHPKFAKDGAIASEEGYRYIPDPEISKEMKERISQIPFIRNLAEKYETFVHYKADGPAANGNGKYTSFMRVFYAVPGKSQLQTKAFIGLSPESEEKATEILLSKVV